MTPDQNKIVTGLAVGFGVLGGIWALMALTHPKRSALAGRNACTWMFTLLSNGRHRYRYIEAWSEEEAHKLLRKAEPAAHVDAVERMECE